MVVLFAFLLYLKMPDFIIFLIQLTFDFVILPRINLVLVSKTQKESMENTSHGVAICKCQHLVVFFFCGQKKG